MKHVLALCLSLMLLLTLAACGGDEADTANLSEEGKMIAKEVGGPFNADEFEKFLVDLPEIPGLTRHDPTTPMTGSAALSAAVKAKVTSLGWNEDRFMYIYSHTMMVLSGQEMDKMQAEMAQQMDGMPEEQRKMMEQMMGQQLGAQFDEFKAEINKQVPVSEQTIIKDNMEDLHKVFGI